MIRDGDPNGLWHTMESSQRCDCKAWKFLNIDFFHSRESVFMSHVPWLGPYAFSVPGVANNLKLFRAHAQNWAKSRIKDGSIRKDLFYYLVRCILTF